MTKNNPMMEMTRRYGHTVYTISAFGNPDTVNTYEDRLLHLIRHEAEKMENGKQSNPSANNPSETNLIKK